MNKKKDKVDPKDEAIKYLKEALLAQVQENLEQEEALQAMKFIIWYLEIKIGLYKGEDDGNKSV